MNTTKSHFPRFVQNFIRCGVTGWCMEIIFTALDSIRRRDMRLTGRTSLWMFPIYGLAAFLSPICHLIHRKPFWFRGLAYMSMIFSAEYLTGSLLSRHKVCPWNYESSRWNIRKLIRLDFAPFWFGAGLMFEQLLEEESTQ